MMSKYNPEQDIGDLSGKIIVITGGTAGIGASTIHLLASHSPAHIFFTGRSQSRANEITREIEVKCPNVSMSFVEMDLASLSSVQEAARQIISQTQRINILICNAGVAALPAGLTRDGYEIQFGTNHLGHALLVKILLPLLLETADQPAADVRVISLSSMSNQKHPPGGIVFEDLTTPQKFRFLGPWRRYAQSKLANILYTAELARRYPNSGILFVSLHPGVFNTGLIQNLPAGKRACVRIGTLGKMKAVGKEGEGAWNTCWCATSRREWIVNGEFYYPVGEIGEKGRENTNVQLAGKLWDWTQKELQNWN